MRFLFFFTFALVPTLIAAIRENCVNQGAECGVLRCCPGFDCDSVTAKCVPEMPKKFCMILGLQCGPDKKKCCPDTHCGELSGRCEIDV